MPDVIVDSILKGRVHLVSLVSETAKTWADEHVSIEPQDWLGLDTFGVDYTGVEALVDIMREEGLDVEVTP